MSLIDLCIDSICQNILCYEVPPSFDVLPPDLVRRIFDSLTSHKALTKLTVSIVCGDETPPSFSVTNPVMHNFVRCLVSIY